MFIRKNKANYCALPHKLVGVQLYQNGSGRYAGMLLRKNRYLFGCRYNNNLSGCFSPKKCSFTAAT